MQCTRYESCFHYTYFHLHMQFFRYCDVTETMTEAMTALSASMKIFVGYGVMFFVVFLAFIHLGHLVFGHHLEDFSTFGLSV